MKEESKAGQDLAREAKSKYKEDIKPKNKELDLEDELVFKSKKEEKLALKKGKIKDERAKDHEAFEEVLRGEKRAKLIGTVVQAAKGTSLGISIVVAVLIGVGLGLGLKALFNATWGLFIGIFIGVAAAILNVYKAYKEQVRLYEDEK